jgi:antitoxin component of RelBE/YafQ-DinJ toxin-antitoxin module
MTATSMVTARLDPTLKKKAGAVLRRANITESELVRKVYEYIVYLGDVPEFVKTGEYEVEDISEADKFSRLVAAIEGSPLAKADLSDATDESIAKTLAERGDS